MTKPDTTPIRIHLVDDHRMMIDMWGTLLGQDPRFRVTGHSLNGENLMADLDKEQPDVILMDISIPGTSGITLTRDIRHHFPKMRVLAVSMHREAVTIRQALLEGALGFVAKTSPYEEMVDAILQVNEGKSYISAELQQVLNRDESGAEDYILAGKISSLTRRELEIVNLIAEGLSSEKIAERLYISRKTVEAHRYNIFRKLNITNAISLVRLVKQTI